MKKVFGGKKNLPANETAIVSEISLTEELNDTFSDLTDQEKMKKAVRHFYDGYFRNFN